MTEKDYSSGVEKELKSIQRFTIIYIFLAGLWILFSDTLLGWFASDLTFYARLQTYKGWAFVLATGLLFYFYLRPRVEEIKKSHNALLAAKDELGESEKKLREAQEMAHFGYWNWDVKTGDVEWSDEVFRIFHLDAGKFVPKIDSILALSPWPEDHQRNDELINRALQSHEVGSYEQKFLRPDTSIGYYYSTFQGKYDDNGSLVLITGTVMDITERKKVELSLLRAKIIAEDNSRMKSEFLANMSHELRTPLTAILGFSDVLSTKSFGELNEKQLQFVDNIYKSGTQLREIIEQMLDISRMETGKMELEIVRFPVSEVLDEIRDSMFHQAKKKGLNLEIVNNIGTAEIYADRLKLRQIIFNLLHNAIKFTPDSGRVTVLVCKVNGQIQFSVSDSGIGIPPEMHEDIFNPFVQVDASDKRRYGGTGLGLFLVKQFVEMHGGKIWLESQSGKGSTFTVSIPVEQ